MIEPVPVTDALLHQPIYNDPTWCETNWFPFLVRSATCAVTCTRPSGPTWAS